jgi:DnaK suppressor protein
MPRESAVKRPTGAKARSTAQKPAPKTASTKPATRPAAARASAAAAKPVAPRKPAAPAKPAAAKGGAGRSPASKSPVAKSPASKSPVAKSIASKSPASKSPVAKSIASKSPASKSPEAKSLAAKSTVAKSPVAKSPAARPGPAEAAAKPKAASAKPAAAATRPGGPPGVEQIMAMPAANYMNAVQLKFFRDLLQDMKRQLLENAGETSEHLRENDMVPDPADRATIEEEHALELRTRDRERKLMKKIDQSLARIEDGSYGYCEETGEPIGLQRLLARPTATLSVEAQQRRELKQRMFGE